MKTKTRIEELLNTGHLTCDTSELYSLVLDDEEIHSEEVYQLKDSLRIILNMLENGYNPNSYYDTDEISRAKRLIKENL